MDTSSFDEQAIYVLQKLQQAGFDSWFVGGCVRDCLINRSFADYDLATCAHPAEVGKLFQADSELDLSAKQFGCVRVNYQGLWLEITTLRRDVHPDGRRTSVEFTRDLAEDAKRRDFTINALYWDGRKISDFFNGQADLKQGRVQFIGNAAERIQEDYLRILRFLRFSSIYASEIDQIGLKACLDHQDGLSYLSGKRVWDEWQKILFAPKAQMVLQAMRDGEIDTTLFGEKLEINICQTYNGYDPLLFTKLLLPGVHIGHLVHRLELSGSQKDWLETASAITPDHDFRYDYLQHGERVKELVHFWAAKFKQNSDKVLAEPFWNVQTPVFPLTGKDILKLGCQTGPIVGKCLQLTKKWWVESNFLPNHEECLRYAKLLT